MKSSCLTSDHLVLDTSLALRVSLPSPKSPTSPRPTRVLRRKGHLSLSRQSAPPAMSPVESDPFIAFKGPTDESRVSLGNSVTHVPITKLRTHYHSNSVPMNGSNTNLGRLGHPSRPYYTAIRKNMTSPDSASVISSSRASSPGLYRPSSPSLYLYDKDFAGDEETPSILSPPYASSTQTTASPRSRFFGPLSGGSSPTSGGFSLSGEMEMRMRLAREIKSTGYKFKLASHGSGSSAAIVKQQVKRFKRGFANLLKR